MPYLDGKIEKHNENCINPVGKRLYIRDYDDKGKQRFVSGGLTCTTCGVVIKEQYERSLTPKELKRKEFLESLEGKEEYKKMLESLKSESWEERLESGRKYKTARKLERLKRARLGKDPMTPQESGLRRRIRGFKKVYEYIGYDWGFKDDNMIEWSDELTEKFLNLVPRPTISELNRVVFPEGLPLIPLTSQNKFRWRGWIPDPEKAGWVKYDPKAFVKLRQEEAEHRQKIMESIIKEREEASHLIIK